MPNRVFPITIEPACQLKWTWSTLKLYNGATSSCHRVLEGSLGLTVDNILQFHNTPKKIADRELMLQGQWPTGGCEYCQQIEQAGGISDRIYHGQISNQYPPELDHDLTATHVTPRIVEVYLDNVCNMSCIYCWDGFSSRIQQENNKFGDFDQDGVVIKNRANKVPDLTALTEKFWDWLRENSHQLRRLHILGGEPFYQKQFETCLSILEQGSNPTLEFNIVSNLKVDPDKFKSYVTRIKQMVDSGKIGRFDLTASIDCFGKEQEYVRNGIDLVQWKTNFEHAVANSWIYLNINQTITSLTIKTMPDLLQYINQLREQNPNREIHQHVITVVGFDFLHPSIFGPGFFDTDLEQILSAMPDQTWQQQQSRDYITGIFKQINNCVRDDTKIKQLVTYLTELDRRRSTNWKQTFPWLEKELEYVV